MWSFHGVSALLWWSRRSQSQNITSYIGPALRHVVGQWLYLNVFCLFIVLVYIIFCIHRYTPDVVFLQELIPPYVEYLKKRAVSYTLIEGTLEKVVLLKKKTKKQ